MFLNAVLHVVPRIINVSYFFLLIWKNLVTFLNVLPHVGQLYLFSLNISSTCPPLAKEPKNIFLLTCIKLYRFNVI